jgi:hypothetical protein
MVFTGLLASIEDTAKSRWLVASRASTMAFGAKKNSEGRFSVKDVSEEVRYLEYQKKASTREACLVK